MSNLDGPTWQETQARRKTERRGDPADAPAAGSRARREARGVPVGTGAPRQAPVASVTPPKAGERPSCLCGCGETTGGGRFRPGHDSRFLSRLTGEVERGRLDRDGAMAALDGMPKLQAKLEKRLVAA